MHDIGIFLIGIGVAALVTVAMALLAAGALQRRRDEQLCDRALYETLVERTRETAQDAAER